MNLNQVFQNFKGSIRPTIIILSLVLVPIIAIQAQPIISSQAPTDTQAEKLIRTLEAKDCTNAKALATSVKSVDYKDKEGINLLIYASFFNCTDVVKTLLDKGAILDIQNTNGTTALSYASQNGFTEVVKLLVNKGAKLDLQNNDGATALFMASKNGFTEIAKLLLDKGATVDIQRLDGATALIFASQNGQTEVVKLLLDKGANPGLKTRFGKTALDVAVNSEIKNLLNSYQKK